MQPFHELSLSQAVQLIKSGEITSQALVESVLDRIKKLNPSINAYVRWDEEKVLTQAKTIDQKIKKGDKVGLLAGVPIAVKDLTHVKGEEITCASKILKGYISPYDACIIEKIKNEDGIICGRTNMDEFAMGSSNENSAYGPVKNPWDLERVTGGSSGGSAACIAADMAIAAIGSDTGGSIRQPACFCGIVGIKPTYGRVSRYGLVAYASSLDQYGPMTKTVEDAALLLEVMSGYDKRDSTCIDKPVPIYKDCLLSSLKGKKMGVPQEFFGDGLDPEAKQILTDNIKYLESMGVEKVNINLPHATEYAVATYYILATAEASSNLSRYDGVQYGVREKTEDLLEMYYKTRGEGFGSEVKRRIILGTYVLSSGYYDAYYLKAQKVRTLIRKDFQKAFSKCDFIVTPVSPFGAFKLGEKLLDPVQMYLSDIYTISLNLAGLPGISVPAGVTQGGLPVGMQIIGSLLDEEMILNVAAMIEKENQISSPKLELEK